MHPFSFLILEIWVFPFSLIKTKFYQFCWYFCRVNFKFLLIYFIIFLLSINFSSSHYYFLPYACIRFNLLFFFQYIKWNVRSLRSYSFLNIGIYSYKFASKNFSCTPYVLLYCIFIFIHPKVFSNFFFSFPFWPIGYLVIYCIIFLLFMNIQNLFLLLIYNFSPLWWEKYFLQFQSL